MTIEQFIIQQREILRELERDNKPLRIAAQTSHVQASERIFGQSKDVNGNTIKYKSFNAGIALVKSSVQRRLGAYSYNYAVYVKGKKGKGRQISRVDFTLDGDFRKDYQNTQTINGTPTPIKITPNEYQVKWKRGKGEGEDKITHAELAEVFENDYYNTEIFTLSKEEIETFFETAEVELAKLVQ